MEGGRSKGESWEESAARKQKRLCGVLTEWHVWKGRWCRDVKRCETSWRKKQSWQCDEWLIKSIIQKNISLLPGLLIYYSWIIYYTHHPCFITVVTRTIHQENPKYSSLWCSSCDIAVCKFSMNTELIVCQFLRTSTALFCVLMHYQAMPEIYFALPLSPPHPLFFSPCPSFNLPLNHSGPSLSRRRLRVRTCIFPSWSLRWSSFCLHYLS